ncbi:unnamed protein product [Calypogeia fissa]
MARLKLSKLVTPSRPAGPPSLASSPSFFTTKVFTTALPIPSSCYHHHDLFQFLPSSSSALYAQGSAHKDPPRSAAVEVEEVEPYKHVNKKVGHRRQQWALDTLYRGEEAGGARGEKGPLPREGRGVALRSYTILSRGLIPEKEPMRDVVVVNGAKGEMPASQQPRVRAPAVSPYIVVAVRTADSGAPKARMPHEYIYSEKRERALACFHSAWSSERGGVGQDKGRRTARGEERRGGEGRWVGEENGRGERAPVTLREEREEGQQNDRRGGLRALIGSASGASAAG